MSDESSPSDAAQRTRRRIIALPQRRAPRPVAIIAHEGEARDALEARLSRVRPAVSYPSLAHFQASADQGDEWAGIVVARSHAWDARLDASVQRRAFIALFGLADEGHGWPDAVKRISTHEELDGWLNELASPVLPPDDRPRVVKTRAKRAPFTMLLAEAEAVPVRTQLSLPILSMELSATAPAPEPEPPALYATVTPTPASPKPGKAESTRPGPRTEPAPRGRKRKVAEQAVTEPPTPVAHTASRSEAVPGLRLVSGNAHEQAVLDAVQALGAAQARYIVDAVEACEGV